jgi:hypothetical protein
MMDMHSRIAVFGGCGVLLLAEHAAADIYNPAHDFFVTSGHALAAVHSPTDRIGIRFTSPSDGKIVEINLFTGYVVSTDQRPDSTPSLKVGIQRAEGGSADPSGVWLGSGTIAATEPFSDPNDPNRPLIQRTRKWIPVVLDPPVSLQKGTVYHIVVECNAEDGSCAASRFNGKHYVDLYAMLGATPIPRTPFNYGEIDTNINRTDPQSTIKFFNGSSWVRAPGGEDLATYYLKSADATYFGQPLAHHRVEPIAGNRHVGEVITISSYDKVVNQLKILVRCEAGAGDLSYSLQQIGGFDTTGHIVDPVVTLSGGVAAAKESCPKDYFDATVDFDQDVTLKQGQTYLLQLESPATGCATCWGVEAPSAIQVLYATDYTGGGGQFPSMQDNWEATRHDGANVVHFEHLVGMTFDARNSYLVRTVSDAKAWYRISLQDLPFTLRNARCPTALDRCDQACVNLRSDVGNCGSCGHACPQGNTCIDGTCQGSQYQDASEPDARPLDADSELGDVTAEPGEAGADRAGGDGDIDVSVGSSASSGEASSGCGCLQAGRRPGRGFSLLLLGTILTLLRRRPARR